MLWMLAGLPLAHGQGDNIRFEPEWRFHFSNGAEVVVDPAKGVFYKATPTSKPLRIRAGVVRGFESTFMPGDSLYDTQTVSDGTHQARMWKAESGFVMYFEMDSGVYAVRQNGKYKKVAPQAGLSLVRGQECQRLSEFEVGGRRYRGLGVMLVDGEGARRPTLVAIRDDGRVALLRARLSASEEIRGFLLDGIPVPNGHTVLRFRVRGSEGTAQRMIFARDWEQQDGFAIFDEVGARSRVYARLAGLQNFQALFPGPVSDEAMASASQVLDALVARTQSLEHPWTVRVDGTLLEPLIAAVETQVGPDRFAGIFEFRIPAGDLSIRQSDRLMEEMARVSRVLRNHGLLVVVRYQGSVYLIHLPKDSGRLLPVRLSPCNLAYLTGA